jgi:hypothetical protein
MRKLFVLGLILLFFPLLSFPHFALASCCTDKCTNNNLTCPSGNLIIDKNCDQVEDCVLGCCCDAASGIRKIACTSSWPTSNFIPSSIDFPVGIDETCTCDLGVTISGTVTERGNPRGGVLVSSGTRSDLSSSSGNIGAYVLNNVPKGNVILSAAITGCFGNKSIYADQDTAGVEIPINCTCMPGCDADNDVYCDNNRVSHFFNLLDADEKEAYCSLCIKEDTDCSSFTLCKAGDGACPVGCTPSTDSDCACNNIVKNGYCPSACNETTDLDCGVDYKVDCGDGDVFYPFETCEPSPNAGQVSYCSGPACVNCNCITTNTCGNGKIDPGEQCEITPCSDGMPCANCRCGQSCQVSAKTPTLTVSFDKALKQAKLRWSLSDICNSDVAYYQPYFCLKSGSNLCTDMGSFTMFNNTYFKGTFDAVMNVLQVSTYSFFVRVRYRDGSVANSAIRTISTGTDYCMNRAAGDPPEFCIDNRRSRCDSNDNIAVISGGDCTALSKYCSGPNIYGTTTCEDQDPCMLCNGLYGSFGKYLDLKLNLPPEYYWCNAGSGRTVVPGCYFDRTRFMFSAYSSCGNAKSCYDLKSNTSCTDRTDPCNINSQCEWVSLPSNPSIGGICRPKNAQQQDCTLCSNPAYNWFSPVCTPEVCGLFGQCYYQGDNAVPACSNREVHTCLEYATDVRCVGPSSSRRAVEIDAAYNSANTRISGTHNVLVSSNDELALGKCFWDSLGGLNGVCRKDADGLRPTNVPGNPGFDCSPYDSLCESDFNPPTTVITSACSPICPASPTIKYDVIDAVYLSNTLKTYFCLVPSAASACYPDETGSVISGEKVYDASSINASGEYNLYYYSTDPAKNLEIVKNIVLKVDADPPFIELIRPNNMSDFATNSATLSIYARTSLDATFVCINNTLLKVTRCVIPCRLPQPVNSTGCIDDGGYFNVTLPIASAGANSTNVPRNILFYAEDLAGNSYSNTMLGIIYDISPPSAPVIVIR